MKRATRTSVRRGTVSREDQLLAALQPLARKLHEERRGGDSPSPEVLAGQTIALFEKHILLGDLAAPLRLKLAAWIASLDSGAPPKR
jgi:hypothetical protein